MLNRRYLRIKVMQALYAFFQSDNADMNKSEKEMLGSIDKMYDLYIYLLLLITEIRDLAENTLEEAKNKRLPTQEDLVPNTKFIESKLIKLLMANNQLKKEAINRKINWQGESELIKRIFNSFKNSDEYAKYMNSTDNSFEADKLFIADIFKKYIAEFELLHSYFEEKSIYWADDLYLINNMVVKTLKSFNENSDENFSLMPLYKDVEEDKQFILQIYRKTIFSDKENEKLIGDKTKNWEVERIAMMDVLLMKMAVTEILNFSSIPVKVTLNEYIEISKLYSTPKSNLFINGILDKLVIDFKEQKKFEKIGRGLIE